MAREYPYFAPAHYLKLIGTRQDAAALFLLQQLYPVNPVLLSSILAAAEQPQAEEVIIPLLEETAVPPTVEAIAPLTEEIAAPLTGETATPHPDKAKEQEEIMLQPASSEDYFLQQGIHVSGALPERNEIAPVHTSQESIPDPEEDKEKSLMVVMSFAEWLKHISSKNQKAKEEEAEQKALKAMWQQQKLAAAIEEESEEIPEQVFEMAVNSISRKDSLISESLAEVYAKQGKKEKAIDMYQKLSLLNPEKNAYFAAKIENLQKDL